MKRLIRWLGPCIALLMFLNVGQARSRHHAARTGRFDYYLLSLSWAPEYCAETPRDHTAECDGSHHFGFVVHGLWPEAVSGPNPQNCNGPAFDQGAVPAGLLAVMPSMGLVEHEWNTHGRCTGLAEKDYLQNVLKAYGAMKVPSSLQAPHNLTQMTPAQIRQAFAGANPNFGQTAFTVNDTGSYLREVRVCYTIALAPQPCSQKGDTRNVEIAVRPVK